MNAFHIENSRPLLIALGALWLHAALGQAALAEPTHLPDRSIYAAPRATAAIGPAIPML